MPKQKPSTRRLSLNRETISLLSRSTLLGRDADRDLERCTGGGMCSIPCILPTCEAQVCFM